MPLYRFKESDKLFNVIETHPRTEFIIYDSQIYLNNRSLESGSFNQYVPNVAPGNVSLYELNVDRLEQETGRVIGTDQVEDTSLIYPFITKQGTISSFKTISTTQYNTQFLYGDVMTGSYPLSSSIIRHFFDTNSTRARVTALKNTLNFYKPISHNYAYTSDRGSQQWDKGTQAINMISIPSIFYGSSIKKGSVNLKFYISGTVIGELTDKSKNGELVQVTGSHYAQQQGSGSIAGVVLYTEGIILLTGSWNLAPDTRDYIDDPSSLKNPQWLYFGVGANDGVQSSIIPSSSYSLTFEGVQEVPTITMLAHANKGELNYSSNPTFVEWEQSGAIAYPSTGALHFTENELKIKNIVSSSFETPNADFEKETYITKIGIYDENRNLIGVANVAKPIKKTEDRDFTFKLKVDI
jgi:hypothetical protein